tara:strand:- start:14866 stop:16188 length:1323 start_codon:yes stop_codon:yes gene_type:complete
MKLFENKYLRLLLVAFFIFVFIFTRSFMGIYVMGFRLGELAILASMACLLLFSLFLRKSPSLALLRESNINLIISLILISFVLIGYLSNSNFINPYTYKASSYIWTIGFFFLGYQVTKNWKLKKKYFNFSLLILLYIYFLAIYDLPIYVQDFILSISDKYEPHKGSDMLIMFITIIFIFIRLNDKRIGIEVLFIFSFLYFPLLLYKSRGAFISLLIYFILEVIRNTKILVNASFFRNLGLLIASVLIAAQSVFFVTQSGPLKITIANEKLNEVTQYRAPELNPGEYVNYLYLKDGRFYSTDVNINWRIEIWQDVFADIKNDNLYLIGHGYSTKIPAMSALDHEGNSVRSGLDGMNENVHNYLVNIYARGGLVHLILFLCLYTYIMKANYKKNNNYSSLIFLIPIMFCSFFDASMENSHFPLILYFLLGTNLNEKNIFDKI